MYHSDPGRMTWRGFVRAVGLAGDFLAWEAGKGKCPADVPPPPPDAAAMGL